MLQQNTYKDFFREEDEGIPGQFWGNEGAGALFVAKDTGRILLFLRSDSVNEPGTWNLVGGKIDYGEDPKQATAREVEEETGYDGVYKMSFLYTFRYRDFKYHNYLVVVPFEFVPQLNWEHNTSKWVEFGEWPQPLHFGLADLLKHAGHKIKKVVDTIKKKLDNNGIVNEIMDIPPPAQIVHVDKPAKSPGVDARALADAYVVAATLWGEARGEGEEGMHAVMNVIMNRAKGDFSKAKNVVLKPKQFSLWNKVADPTAASLELASTQRTGRAKDHPSYLKALELVDLAMKGQLTDITGGATFYFNPHKVLPKWAKVMSKTKTIGNHNFYRLPPQAEKHLKKAKKKKHMKEVFDDHNVVKTGLEGPDTYTYEMTSPHAYLRYAYSPNSRMFYLRNIGTPVEANRNQGYAKELLAHFFYLIKQSNGALDPGTYTTSGNAYVKHVVDRLAKQYNVKLMKGNDFV